MKKTIKYKTHPIYKALMWLMLILTVSALFFAWAVFAAAEMKEEKCEKMISECKYEAYLSFCEKLSELSKAEEAVAEVSRSAGEALGRYVMLSGLKIDPDALMGRLLSARIEGDEAAELLTLIEASNDSDEAIMAVIEAVEGGGDGGPPSRERKIDGWNWLSSQPEVKESCAKKLAERFIGGGGNVRAAESHVFPPVYAYVNGNACAEITRMGGRLIRVCKLPVGSASRRGRLECVAAAERFLRDAGISGAELASCSECADGVDCRFSVGRAGDANVTVEVAFCGATVVYFDAYEYYRWRQ